MKIPRIFFLFISLITLSAQAQVKAPCITKYQNVDFACRCRKTRTCMKALSKNEQKQIANQKNPTTTKYYKKITKISLPGYKLLNKMFKGEINLQKFPYEKLKTAEKKIDNFLKKIKPKVEKTYKKMGAKVYKLEDRDKKYLAKINKNIPKSVKEALRNNKLNVKSTGRNSSIASSSKQNKRTKKDEVLNNTKKQKVLAKTSNNEFTQVDASRDARSLLKTKKYKVNDIHAAHKEIWKIVSNRYGLVQKRLDQKAIASGKFNKEDVDALRRSVLQKLKLF